MHIELTALPGVKAVLRNRWWQFVLTLTTLAVFILAIVSGSVGTPVGSRNFAIVFVWILWWALLILLAVPFLGRAWCSICPIPAPGEWAQRGAILKPPVSNRARPLRRWAARWRNIWLQNAMFLLVALFSIVILTQPAVTSLVLLALLLLAIGVSLVYERRTFCRYLCPVGGFIGLYAQLSPLELRVKDTSICATHAEKLCYTGSAQGYGCPWMVFPAALKVNTNCGLCMECLRTCSLDNIAVNIRPIGDDLQRIGIGRMDEAYKAFIMLGSALVYVFVLLGPWGWLKRLAYSVGTLPWLGYALGFLLVLLVALPGLFALAVWLGNHLAKARGSLRRSFVTYAYSLIPLSLSAWIAFTLAFVFANLSYVWGVISDPLGVGWNLLGTADWGWQPYLTSLTPYLVSLVLMIGLVWSANHVAYLARQQLSPARALRQALPVIGYCLVYTLTLMGVLIL